MVIELLRLLVIAYLILLALAALFGYGSQVLAYPFLVLYSSVRLILLTLSLGRINLESQGRRFRRRSGFHWRSLKSEIRQRRQERDESNLLQLGENPGRWASINDENGQS